MAIKDGHAIVDKLFNSVYDKTDGRFHFEKLPYAAFLSPAAETFRKRKRVFTAPACGIGYDDTYNETLTPEVALMLAEYTAGMLLDKAVKHCYHHPKPCHESMKLHRQMLEYFRDDLTWASPTALKR